MSSNDASICTTMPVHLSLSVKNHIEPELRGHFTAYPFITDSTRGCGCCAAFRIPRSMLFDLRR
jgi:hypothetical protein